MDRVFEQDEDEDERGVGRPEKDREISLGMTMILGIFFALAVLCAVFFGFGYSLGRRSQVVTGPAVVAGGSSTVAPPVGGGVKPSPGNARETADALTAGTGAKTMVADVDSTVVGDTVAPAPVPKSVAAKPVVTPGGTSVVQVAAVSHQEDADLLTSTLKRRGYAVSIRSEPQDKLLHVQVGPFATHQDADVMRQRLLADGFNAIVKDKL